MEITEHQLFDYIYCPTKYHIKYCMGIDLKEEVSLAKLLKQVTNYFFINLNNGTIPSYNQVKKKWDVIAEKNELDGQKVLQGWGYLMKFMQWAETNKIIVGDVESAYTIKIDNNILVHGNIETILVTPQRKIELLNVVYNTRLPDQIDIDMKLKYTLDYLGFKSIYNKNADIIKVHSVKHNTTFLTTRTEPDITRIEDTIRSVAKSIDNNLFYPRESSFCSTCAAKQYCKYWRNT